MTKLVSYRIKLVNPSFYVSLINKVRHAPSLKGVVTKQSPRSIYLPDIPSPDKADNGDPCPRLAPPLELSSDI